MTPDPGDAAQTLRVETHEEGPTVRTVEVEVPAERVTAAFERTWRGLVQRVRVRGFRPGKVPRSVLQRLYGAAVAEEIEGQLVSETLGAALAQAGVEPVAEPAVESEPPVDGQPFRYRVRIEVKPPIELPELSGLPAQRPAVEVPESEVEQELESVRERHATLVEEPEETAAARGHVLTVNFEGRIGGEPFPGGSATDHEIELGTGQLLPGFEEQLEGARSGERRTVRVSFPEDHPNETLRGREAEFDVEVTAVRRRETPALDDELARDVGEFDSLDALRREIRTRLEEAREREAKAAVRRSVLDALIERASFDVPPGVVEARLQRRLAMARRELEGRIPPVALEAHLARVEEEWRPEAERDVREQWLLQAVADAHGIEVSDEEVEAKLAEMAEAQGVPVDRLRQAYAEAGVLDALRERLREERALEFLLAAAKIEEVTGT